MLHCFVGDFAPRGHFRQLQGSGDRNEHSGSSKSFARSGSQDTDGLRLPDSHCDHVEAATPSFCDASLVVRFLCVRHQARLRAKHPSRFFCPVFQARILGSPMVNCAPTRKNGMGANSSRTCRRHLEGPKNTAQQAAPDWARAWCDRVLVQ